MMNASVKAEYETDKTAAPTGRATVGFNVSDFKLKASMTDATIVNGPSFNGLALALEKPGSFIFDYKFHEKEEKNARCPLLPDLSFQFLNSVKILEKPLNLKYIHNIGKEETILDGTLVFNSANKVSAIHELGSERYKLKYSYVHGGLTTLEPSYDTEEKSWGLAVSRRVFGDHVCGATYHTKSNDLGLEWSRSSKLDGSFKVSAFLCLDELTWPKLTAESSWDF